MTTPRITASAERGAMILKAAGYDDAELYKALADLAAFALQRRLDFVGIATAAAARVSVSPPS